MCVCVYGRDGLGRQRGSQEEADANAEPIPEASVLQMKTVIT